MSGIYLHIPFCKQACHYCDFHFSTSLNKKDDLIQALVNEIKLRKHELNNQTVDTIYFGGGTPSLLSREELIVLINTVNDNFNVSEQPEITLEANPDDLTKEQILQLSNSPVNRLSIGVQSFFEDDLKFMNRAHNAQDAIKCLELATQYFDNITIDLIYGIPGLSHERWKKNLKFAFDFGINHISSYALTVEPKTALATFIKNGKYPDVSEQESREHFEILVDEASKNEFVHYEISNFGKEGYFSKHNSSYWQGKPYLGIGPSAHSFNGIQRSWNVSNNAKYIDAIQNKIFPSETETLSKKDQFNEYIMTGLRTIWGVSLDLIETKFGTSYKTHAMNSSKKFIDKDLMHIDNDQLSTTKKGKFLVDGIASELFMI